MTLQGLRFALHSAAILCGLTFTANALLAQMQPSIVIYRGGTAQENALALKAWGSGKSEETGEFTFSGTKSIRVETHGKYSGARLVLQNPVDLKSVLDNKAAYLVLTLRTSDKTAGGMRLGPGYGGFGGFPGGPPPGLIGQYGRGGVGGGRLGGGPEGGGRIGGEFGTNNATVVKPKPLENIRVVLITTDHKRIEMLMPLESAVKSQDEWNKLSVSVPSISALKSSSGQIKEVLIFGDAPATFYVGEIRTIQDETPIRVESMTEKIIPVNETVTFTASAQGGMAPLRYEWFVSPAEEVPANTSNLPVDAEGKTFKHQFRKSGEYVVILTVRDIYGIKQPASTRVRVRATL